MTTSSLVVIGAGGHAKVVIEILRSTGAVPVWCIGSTGTGEATCSGVPVLEGDDNLARLRAEGFDEAVVAVGSNALRVKLGQHALELGYRLPTVVSPRANVSPSVMLGAGTVVMPGAAINAEARVGELAIVNTNASVDHDCVVGRGAHVAPNVALAGNVTVGDLSFLGVGSTVVPGVTIGTEVIVGAGAVVLSNVSDGMTVVGAPAHPVVR